MQPTRTFNSTPEDTILAVSLELACSAWKVALHDGKREKASIRTVSEAAASDRLEGAVRIIEDTRSRWGLPAETRVVIVYEAGQDGFWIARSLCQLGYEAHVCDPGSIPVERHARRAKTDRLDAIKLVLALRAWLRGETDRMHMTTIPPADAEAQRHLARERGTLQKEIEQHLDRINKLLRTVGCWDGASVDVVQRLADGTLRCHDGKALPSELRDRLARECERLVLAEKQFREREAKLVSELPTPIQERIANLKQLKGIGPVGAMRMSLELFWRRFDNRRQVGSCLGLVPQPYNSGDSQIDQGISQQGNGRVRSLFIELAWLWLRYQPDSDITKWFNERTQGTGPNKRAKRIAIVAVARRLAIAIWRYIDYGVVPAGAEFKVGGKTVRA